jgi:hypothetical protein
VCFLRVLCSSFLTLISHHQHNLFLQAGDADYLTFGGHKLYESDYLRSLQWHGIVKDSSLQGRGRMRGGMPDGGKGSSPSSAGSSSDKDGTGQASDDAAPAQGSRGGGGNDKHHFNQSSGVRAEPNDDARFQAIRNDHPSVITVSSLIRLRALTAARLDIILNDVGLSNDESADLAILAATPAGTCSLLAAVVCCRGSTHSHSTHILNLYHHHTLILFRRITTILPSAAARPPRLSSILPPRD